VLCRYASLCRLIDLFVHIFGLMMCGVVNVHMDVGAGCTEWSNKALVSGHNGVIRCILPGRHTYVALIYPW